MDKENQMKITRIYEPINITDEMRHLADEMGEAISTEYEKRALADERKLEAVLKKNGWRKASEVVREIADFIWDNEIQGILISMNGRYLSKQDFIEHFEKKYTEGGKEQDG